LPPNRLALLKPNTCPNGILWYSFICSAWLSVFTVCRPLLLKNIDIVSYVENLKKSVNFTDVYLEESKQVEFEKVPVYKFKLNFKVKV